LTDLVLSNECYSVLKTEEDCRKTYILNLDYENNKTIFWYYSVTNEQIQIKGYRPKKLKKELPLLTSIPDFREPNRNKLFNKLDSWILMS
jgi:hypothetical protein